ncbi:MAG: FhaA domain-containing protein [Chitinophagales bacterium]
MKLAGRLEDWLQERIEGLFRRRPGAVQPLEIGRRLARLMELEKRVSVSEVYAPNAFTVKLAPADHARLTSLEGHLSDELARHLAEVARRQGYALVGPLSIAWQEEPGLAEGTFAAEAKFGEAGVASVLPAEPPGEDTLTFRRTEGKAGPGAAGEAAVPARPEGPAVVVVRGPDLGKSLRLQPGENRVGRGEENALVLSDANASRRHAEFVFEGGRTRLRDLKSRNGTFHNGVRVNEAEVKDGDEVQIGLNTLRFRVR